MANKRPDSKVVDLPRPDRDKSVAWSETSLYTVGDFPRYNPDDLVGRKGLRIYDEMMRDEQVKAVVKFKRDAITSRDFLFKFSDNVDLDDDEKKRRVNLSSLIVEQILGSWPDAMNHVMRGLVHGYSITEKILGFIEFEGRNYYGIRQLLPKPPETFYFYTDPYGSLIRFEQRVSGRTKTLDISKFIHFVNGPDKDEYYGQSDLREAHRAWYSKDITIKLRNLWLEKMAGGFVWLEQEGAVALSETERTQLQSAISNIRTVTSMILPQGYKLNVHNPADSRAFDDAIVSHNLAIAKSLLVPNLLGLSETGATGAYAQSQTQLEAFFWTLNADATRLQAALNEQLFRPLGEANWADGLWPRFCFKPASQEHIKWIVTTWTGLVGAGVMHMTADDEAHLRKILDMPPISDEDAATPLTEGPYSKAPPDQAPAGSPRSSPEGGRPSKDKFSRSYGWDEAEHPRHPKGTSEGGQFAPKGHGAYKREAEGEEFLDMSLEHAAASTQTASNIRRKINYELTTRGYKLIHSQWDLDQYAKYEGQRGLRDKWLHVTRYDVSMNVVGPAGNVTRGGRTRRTFAHVIRVDKRRHRVPLRNKADYEHWQGIDAARAQKAKFFLGHNLSSGDIRALRKLNRKLGMSADNDAEEIIWGTEDELHDYLEFKYNPEQLRIPKGYPGGGRWTTEFGGILTVAMVKGGFTYDVIHHTSPSTGFVLSVDEQYETIHEVESVTADTLREFRDAHIDLFRSNPSKMMGLYLPDPAETAGNRRLLIIDVVTVVQDRAKAMRLAYEHKQESFYDLKEHTVVPVGAHEGRFTRQGQTADLRSAEDDARGNGGGDPQGGGPARLYTASVAAFTRATQRVAFAVIDRKSEDIALEGVSNISRAVAHAVGRLITDERMVTITSEDVEHMRFDGGDVGKIKAACRAALLESYRLGAVHAHNEMQRATGKLTFASTREIAAEWLEAQGARMAGNIADGARAIISAELLNGIKFGRSPVQVRDSILTRLFRRGFAFLADLLFDVKERGLESDLEPEPVASLPQYIASLARTNLFEAMNEARFATFTDPQLEGFVVGLEYSPILDQRTTVICTALDGFTRRADDPIWNVYRPPNHWNCRSLLIPITKVDEWDGTTSPDPTVVPQEGFGDEL